MEEIFKQLTQSIRNCEKIIFMTHQNMDLDGFASILALSSIANSLKKENYILIDNNQKNTSIKKCLNQLQESKLNFNYIYKRDVLKHLTDGAIIIILDVHKPTMVEMPSLLMKTNNIIVIDHHIKCKQYIQNTILNYINSNMSSTIEIVSGYLRFMNKTVDPVIATMMLAGMEIDTNSFNVKTASTTYETAAFLMNMGADNVLKQELLKEDKDEYMSRQKYIENSYMFKTNIAICTLDNKIVDGNILAQIAEDLLQFDNVESAYCIGYISKNKVGISARSLGKENVEHIIKNLGGGGHSTEAATQIKNVNIESALNMLMNELDKEVEI
ncbi:MAG: hypothetical protein HFI87_00700 [Bacilli bacterium]|nr:hypothetical protein [Bacilli bacterium]